MTLPNAVDLVRSLVAEPSVSSPDPRFDQPNRAVIDLLAEWAEHLGFRVEVAPLPSDPSKANLIATLGDGPGGFVLSGHSDTVPFDEARWATDPLELVADDAGLLFGRGSADMKGFFGAALHAAARFDAASLKEPLILIATADEESTMNGARALVSERRPKATRALVGEPTDLAPVRMHKGILMKELRLEGSSGHSSDPSLGRSALEGMHLAIGAILGWRDAQAKANTNAAFSVPTPTLNLGRVAGGDSPNRICASCALTFDVRVLPGMDPAATQDELRRVVEEALAGSDLAIDLRDLVEGVPPFETPADASLVQAAESLSGQPARAVMFCTEAPFLTELGMETIVCGPGSIDVAHQPNEHTSVGQLDSATELYAKLIHRFCVEPES